MKIWIVSTCIPEPGEGPCIPSPFATEAEAEAYADKMMREEWETADPHDDADEPEPYPGDWREAQRRLVEWNGPEWGTWEITVHDLPGIALNTVYGIASDGSDGTCIEFFDSEAARDNAIWDKITPLHDYPSTGEEIDPDEYRARFNGDWGEAMDSWMPTHLTIATDEYRVATTVPCDALRKFLDASTAHVSEESAKWLDEQGRLAAAVNTDDDEHPAIHVGRLVTGWFFYADPEDAPSADPVPADVVALMREARKRGCHYVLLDRDAPEIDGLPVYEW